MRYSWFKVDSQGWIEGSIRVTLSPVQRSVWIDLLALASECRVRDGTLRYAPDLPMSRQFIAERLRIPLETLNDAIEACSQDKNKDDDKHRIEIWDDGTIQITNWEYYQSVPFKRGHEDGRARELRERRTGRLYAQLHPDEAIDGIGEQRVRQLLDGGKREDFLTPEEVAQGLGISVMAVYNLIKEGKLESIKVGDTFRLPKEVLVARAKGDKDQDKDKLKGEGVNDRQS